MADRLARLAGFTLVAMLLSSVSPGAPPVAVAQTGMVKGRAAIDTALELASFDSAWRRVFDTYYDPGMRGLDWKAIRDEYRPLVAHAQSRNEVRAIIGRMLGRLGDSHFGIIPSDEVLESEHSAGVGDAPGDVGIDVRFVVGDLMVVGVDSASPASRAQVRPGWIVELIDSVGVASLASEATNNRERRSLALHHLLNVIRRLHGPPGSTVRVTFRDGAGRSRSLVMVRRPAPGTVVRLGALPPIPTHLEQRRIDRVRGCVGVIRFNTWMTVIAPAFEDALAALRSCEGMVLDLRGNVGGLAAMVMGMAGHFVDSELVLGVMHMRGTEMRYIANPRRVARDGSPVQPYAGPLALIVDNLSASTTEIFVAALQQHGRARVFGDTTAGEALPSLLTRLPNGDGMLYAIADLTDPAGRRVEGVGVVPDERLPLSRESLLAGRDDALAAALRWLDGQRRHPKVP